MAKWGSEQTYKFVEEYHRHPCLWDTAHKHYKIRDKRTEAMSRIVSAMNIDGFDLQEARRKMKIIRSTYLLEKKKIFIKSKRSGGGTAEGCTSKLAWFSLADEFLAKNDMSKAETSFVSHLLL